MIGNIRWNFMISTFAMIMTIVFSYQYNVLVTSLKRGLYCFIALFFIVFIIRWVLHLILKVQPDHDNSSIKAPGEEFKGNHVDMSTPEELDTTSPSMPEDSSDMQSNHQFSPLSPPQFTTLDQDSVEEVVKVIRHMSED